MSKTSLTRWIGIGILAAVIGVDIWLATSDHQTISQYIRDVTYLHPLGMYVPIIFGVVYGHFFIPQRPPKKKCPKCGEQYR
jgi:hypothetical protein